MRIVNFVEKKWIAACSLLSFFWSSHILAARPLVLNTGGVDSNTDDPLTYWGEVLLVIGTAALSVMGFIFLVVFIKQLIKSYGEAKDDGKWWKLGIEGLVGLLILLIIVFLISLGLGVLQG